MSSSRMRSALMVLDFWRVRLDGREGFGLDLKTELRRETHGAQQAQMIFGKPFRRASRWCG